MYLYSNNTCENHNYFMETLCTEKWKLKCIRNIPQAKQCKNCWQYEALPKFETNVFKL